MDACLSGGAAGDYWANWVVEAGIVAAVFARACRGVSLKEQARRRLRPRRPTGLRNACHRQDHHRRGSGGGGRLRSRQVPAVACCGMDETPVPTAPSGESSNDSSRPGLARTTLPPTILTVHAHPDDEASKGAPTLAMYGERGVRTVLVCGTGGEEGELQNPTLREPGQPFHDLTPEAERTLVASMRADELAKSAAIIGFDEVVMLGYRDSGMADSPPNEHPDCFHQADLDEAVGRLVAVIRRTKPQIILTYNDDQQGYPHPDHLRVHDISVLAFDRAGDPAWYPDLGEPFTPLKLYYTTWSRRRAIAVHEGLLKHRGESPYDDNWLDRPNTDHRVTTSIEVGKYLWARTGSLMAHATQVDPTAAFWFGLNDDELAEIYPWEEWILAKSLVGPIPETDSETDLFAGIEFVDSAIDVGGEADR